MADQILSLQRSRDIVDQAIRRSTDAGWLVSVAVMSTTGSLISFASMDGAFPLTTQIACAKAYTVTRTGGRSTAVLESLVTDDPLFERLMTVDRDLLAVGGGEPISSDGAFIGAVGISGAPTSGKDADIARASVEATFPHVAPNA